MSAPPLVSRIEAVTVFNRGAMITRVAEVDGVAIADPVRITGLPLAADDSSVRARFEASSPSDLAVTDVRVSLEAPGADRVTPPDQRELDEARQTERRVRAEVARAERELGRLQSVAVPARPRVRDGRPSPGPVASRLILLDRLRVRGERLAGELAGLRLDLGRAQWRRNELEERLRRASSERPLEPHALRKTAVVTIGGAADPALPARGRLHLEYFVPGARWAPAYVVRVARDGASAEIEVRAVAAQRTGEDWTAVRLTLSTAAPQQWVELPELPSMRIGRRQRPPARTGWRALPPGIEELYSDWDRAFRHAPEPPAEGVTEGPARTLVLEAQSLEAEPGDEESVRESVHFDPRQSIRGRVAPAGRRPAPQATAAPQPPAAPRPSYEDAVPVSAMPASRSMGGGGSFFGGLFDSSPAPKPTAVAGGATPRRAAAAPRPSRSAPGMTGAGMTDAAMTGPTEIPEPTELGAPAAMLDYGRLRMPPPGSRHRGRLVQAKAAELYFELLVDVRLKTRIVLKLVGQAVQSARDAAVGAGDSLSPHYRLAATSEGFDYAWTGGTPVDIPSDGDYHSVPLTSGPATSRMRLVTVPREALDVFRSLELDNPFPAALLAGPVDVYLGGEFLLTTDLKTTAPGGRTRLGLGVEPSVKVARNARFREETTGLTSGTLVLDHRIEVDLSSLLPHAVQVEVRERVPVAPADHSDVKVEIGEAKPAWESYDPPPDHGELLRGGRRWTVSLAPGEKKRLEAGYRIRLPAKDEVVGGNRREP